MPEEKLPASKEYQSSNAIESKTLNISNGPQSPINKRPSRKLILIVLFIISLIIILLTSFLFLSKKYFSKSDYIESNQPYEQRNKPTITLIPVPTIEISKDTFEGYPYFQNDEIYLNNEKLTNTKSKISKYLYSEEKNAFIYLVDTRENNSTNTTDLGVKSVFILKPGQSPKKIFEQKTIPIPNVEFLDSVEDIAYSKDGERIAVTTSDDLYIFDSNGNPIDEYHFPKFSPQSNVNSYTEPIFSPDNSKLLISRYYFEAVDQIILDLNSKKVTETDYGFFMAGKQAVDWTNEDKIIVHTFESDDPNKPMDLKYSLSAVSPETLQGKKYKLEGELISEVSVGDNIYIITSPTPYTQNETEANLQQFNSDNGSFKNIAKLRVPALSQVNIMHYSKKYNTIFVSITSDTQLANSIYRIDLSNPNPKFILWKNNATL